MRPDHKRILHRFAQSGFQVVNSWKVGHTAEVDFANLRDVCYCTSWLAVHCAPSYDMLETWKIDIDVCPIAEDRCHKTSSAAFDVYLEPEAVRYPCDLCFERALFRD